MFASPPTTNELLLCTSGVGVLSFSLHMTKDKYLEKIAYVKSDIRVLIASTKPGSERVLLEKTNELLQTLYDKIVDMPANIYELVSN